MSLLQRFRRDQRGNFATIFALAIIPVMGATGAAVDWSNAFRQRSIVQDALDSAALAANKKIGSATDTQIKAEADYFYQANVAGQVKSPPVITTVVDKGTVTITTTLTVPTSFLGVVGLNNIVFDLKTMTTAGNTRLEIAMVLDTSGSMAGTKISTLKTAATNLTNKLFVLASTSNKTDPLKMAIIPFASSVNVGSANKTAAWMDTVGNGTYHRENMEAGATKTRFDLYTDMNVAWLGCMEERPNPYDATDDAPSTASSPTAEQKKTLFVPMFAPDEPDSWTSGSPNDYLSDRGTGNAPNCAPKAATTTSSNETAALLRVCKYKGVTPTSMTSLLSLPGGPNFNCNSTAITPLTTSQSTVLAGITALQAQGTTNITAGVMWGWRALSPTAPFTEGRSYSDTDNKKVLILMTDGENTYFANSTYKKSYYGAFGYINDNHLGTTSTDSTVWEGKMDARSKVACDNIKATQKITIYTISFQVTTDRGKALMAYCASDADKAFDASDSTELLAAFDAIGTDLSQLRVAN